jgi:hypothetical protein
MTASRLCLGALALLLSATGCAHSPPALNSAATDAAEQTFDRVAVRELLERFSDAVNHGQFEIIPTLFTEDAVWEAKIAPDAELGLGEGFHFRGPDGIRTGLAKSRERAEPLFYSVIPGPIELHGNGRASSRSTMYELLHVKGNGSVLDLVGTYSDTFVEHDGVWRFASRSFRLRYAAEATPPKYRAPR